MSALGLTTQNLFPENSKPARSAKGKQNLGPIVRVYSYNDLNLKLRFQVCRYEPKGKPKTFRQRQPDGKGGWKWSIEGAPKLLYDVWRLRVRPDFVTLCEGEKDAQRAQREGLLGTTNAGGAKKWCSEHSEQLRGRLVALVPDNDESGRKHVERAASSLHGVAAGVRVVELPGLPGKGDLSDWFDAGHTAEEFRQLVKAAPDWVPTETRAVLSEDDPDHLAHTYLAGKPPGGLHFHRGEWWLWEGTRYQRQSRDVMRSKVWAAVSDEYTRLNLVALESPQDSEKIPTRRKPSLALVNNVLAALASMVTLPDDREPGTWLDGRRGPLCVALQNGVLDIEALLAGRDDHLLPHAPEWLSPVCLPYPFDPAADCLTWKRTLEYNLGGDRERIQLLQEWAGYCLTPDTSQQRFLFLEGDGANGKSVYCAGLVAILGLSNVSHVPLEVFGQRFALGGTIGKLANVATEVGELDKAAEGLLKSFTAGERMTFDRKGISAIEVTPTARLVLAANNRPRFSDRSGGLWRRMLLVPFVVEIQESERIYGMDKPQWWADQGELPGLFNWALAGLFRLREQGRFTIPQVMEAALDDYRAETNPARSFLLECCRAASDVSVEIAELYEGYRGWCKDNGHTFPLARQQFGREVRRVFRRVKRVRPGSLGRRECYQGVAFSPI